MQRFLLLILALIIVISGLSWYFLGLEKFIPIVPILFFGSFTLIFSYLAFYYNKEKFRLDLFDRRWEIYENLVKFFSITIQIGSIEDHTDKSKIDSFHESASLAFRGLGIHKARLLFGKDIYKLLAEINETYAFLSTFSKMDSSKYSQEHTNHLKFSMDTLNKLPIIFDEYLNFGRYKH